uniref:Serine/threonine-protein kinase TOR n=2 Tax=Lepeophtheirus salmonis TaxID=72036 RepID=A0A0K2TDA5_LEPSM
MVNTSVLRAIGDLAHVGGTLMKSYVDELLMLLLEMLNDSSSNQKREVSLWVLAQLVESTGSVITPYHRYPSLLDTLLNFLRLDQRPPIRTRTLRLLGLLGALDPYRHKMNMGQIDSAVVQSAPLIAINDTQSEMEQSYEMTTSEMLVNMGTGNLEEFYPSVAIASLMKIIRDTAQQHNDVVKAVTFIFKALGVKSVPYIPQVIPSMMNVIRTSDSAGREFLFQQLGSLISIVRQHIRNDLEDIFTLIKEFWVVGSQLQSTIIFLVENIAAALGSEFKVYLPQLIPQILRVLMHDSSEDRDVTVKLLAALQKFGNTLDDYIHLILPPIVKLFDSSEIPIPTRKAALDCIDQLTDTIDFSEYASRIIHPLVRCLDSCPELRPSAMETLTSLAWQLGKKYTIFIHMVHKVLINHKINHQRYDILYARLKDPTGHIGPLEDVRSSRMRNRKQDFSELLPPSSDINMVKKHPFSAMNLQKAWIVNRRVSKDDWLEWHSKLCIELLKASPSPALRACSAVAQQYSQLAKDLFNASFVSCWSELDATQQDELMSSLEQALTVPDLPEISQTILNLAEFMERCDKGPLPLDPILLGEQAMRCRAFAKALHYKEDEFHKASSVPVLEALIAINNKLGQKEAAAGLLDWGRKNLTGDLKVQERWYEKLHDWDRALGEYERKAVEDSKDPELILGKMRCLEAMGDWSDLHTISKDKWEGASNDTRNKMARMASTAAWGLQDWEAMEKFVNCLPKESQDGGFYRAVLSIHHENWNYAEKLIDMTRELLDREVTALSLESYQRVYPTMVSVQMLVELEEVIEYKLIPERRSTIKEMWWDRLQGCQRVVEDWQRIMQVRSLVLSPQEDQRTWLKYASLCRKSGRLQLSNKTLVTILGTDPAENSNSRLPTTHPRASFAYCKHLWASDLKERALLRLEEFVSQYLEPLIYPMNQNPKNDEESGKEKRELNQLLARCYLKLGQWQENLQGLNEKSIPKVFDYYASSTEYDTDWYKAWHSLAVWSFESVLYHKINGVSNSNKNSKDFEVYIISTYGVPALKGFVRSINLSKGSSLQDTLRLLTLLFDYGHQVGMYEALHEGIRTIEIDNWLQVIPQLIARIDTPKPLVSRLIHQLLTDVGKHHPQALVYSLTVACKSNNVSRRQAALKILNKMKEHSETLVNHAVTISDELIRVAILWHEQWHEGLEEASRMFFGDLNIQGMMAVLEPLHKMLEAGPQTLKEISFQTTYGQEITEAKKYCQRYQQCNDMRHLNHAWDIYYQVFRRITRQLPQLTQLELQYVSPQLLMCRDLELAVPGSYVPHQPLIRIMSVQPSLQVITSKQRPRKLCLRGSNGKTFMFLLKGHEDLRQDERVMQFFSLVNSLLLNDPETYRRNLAIQRFAVIPLSTNSGLIGWVPHSDTLHGLIKDYREKKRILLNIEHRIMQKMTNDYDNLPLMNKVEVFEHSLEHTNGDDLATLLLLKSPSSEIWFDRRTNLTRSLAVMSMVGYVLGLGDRHPSNLLLDRMSGKILHIDFGDCFEVAMTREKYPEKIPFRLTRMLINAMEVTGIEGTYRRTCESVMTVLRRNKDSLMAVLEAFVYDPLLNWRLTNAPNKQKTKTHEQVLSNSGEDISGSVSSSVLRKLDSIDHTDPDTIEPEALDPKALEAIQRVRDKLKGRDFKDKYNLVVAEQVDLLIKQATSNENLCQCYVGWCAFW